MRSSCPRRGPHQTETARPRGPRTPVTAPTPGGGAAPPAPAAARGPAASLFSLGSRGPAARQPQPQRVVAPSGHRTAPTRASGHGHGGVECIFSSIGTHVFYTTTTPRRLLGSQQGQPASHHMKSERRCAQSALCSDSTPVGVRSARSAWSTTASVAGSQNARTVRAAPAVRDRCERTGARDATGRYQSAREAPRSLLQPPQHPQRPCWSQERRC